MMSWWHLRPGKKICFQHTDELQMILVCWLGRQKHLQQHCESFSVFYTVTVNDNTHYISCLNILIFHYTA